MKKLLIGSFVGAILLFGWLSISWTAVGIHDNAFKYVASQDSIINYLASHLSEEGEYMVPRTNPQLSKDKQLKEQEAMMSRPWAVINFHRAFESSMGKTIAIGFINCFICVLLACLVVRKFDTRYKNFFSLFTSVLTFGVISFLFVWYNQQNWFQATWQFLWGELIDCFAGWGLAGIWLAWWYRK